MMHMLTSFTDDFFFIRATSFCQQKPFFSCYCFQVNTKDKVSLFCSVKPEECAAVVVDQISKCVFDDIEGANKVSAIIDRGHLSSVL